MTQGTLFEGNKSIYFFYKQQLCEGEIYPEKSRTFMLLYRKGLMMMWVDTRRILVHKVTISL